MPELNDRILYDQLKELAVIDAPKLDAAAKTASETRRPLADILFESDLMSDDQIGRIQSEIFGLPFVVLSRREIKNEILTSLPEIFCRRQKLIAFNKDKSGIHVAAADPENRQAIDFVAKKTGLPVVTYYATSRDINTVLDTSSGMASAGFDDDLARLIAAAENNYSEGHPVVAIVDMILSRAHKNRASDIHLEPQKLRAVIRFRIDGILYDIATLPLSIFPEIITRIKVLSGLRTDEHHSAQDGKLQQNIDNETVDFRVSLTPTIDGEKAVLRLLASKSRQFSLTNLGLEDDDLKLLTEAYQKPYGMILSTGPTGSGKTTTLYALLKLLNHRDVNIMTIEDPVEYEIEGINQIQVDPKTNLTFAAGLRSVVRQDPNIILVGEIRDRETAEIAVNAAMTGHLVLSSLHTNDAATTIPRLFDMGIEPFLVASSVNAIIAQRLVRTICPNCRASEEVNRYKLLKLGFPVALLTKYFGKKTLLRLYRGRGCPVCHGSGYSGRIGIFEIMVISENLRTAITGRLTSADITKLAVKNGMTPMLEDGFKKIKNGLTTVEEVLRVTKI